MSQVPAGARRVDRRKRHEIPFPFEMDSVDSGHSRSVRRGVQQQCASCSGTIGSCKVAALLLGEGLLTESQEPHAKVQRSPSPGLQGLATLRGIVFSEQQQRKVRRGCFTMGWLPRRAGRGLRRGHERLSDVGIRLLFGSRCDGREVGICLHAPLPGMGYAPHALRWRPQS